MKTKEIKYWLGEFDRFGLVFGGIFIGALAELTEIRTLGIIISVAGLICIGILDVFFKLKLKDSKEGEKT